MVAVGARTFQQEYDVETARKLANGCVWAYNSMPSGIMPEIMNAVPCPPSHLDDCDWNEQSWYQAVLSRAPYNHNANLPTEDAAQELIEVNRLPPGFSRIQDAKYILRPEAIESVFIMYRVTGDVGWQDKAWTIFSAIEQAAKTELAYAALKDVSFSSPQRVDEMESFWTAETLKYFYLTFSDPNLISLDDYVFNTEAHPFRRPKNPKAAWS